MEYNKVKELVVGKEYNLNILEGSGNWIKVVAEFRGQSDWDDTFKFLPKSQNRTVHFNAREIMSAKERL